MNITKYLKPPARYPSLPSLYIIMVSFPGISTWKASSAIIPKLRNFQHLEMRLVTSFVKPSNEFWGVQKNAQENTFFDRFDMSIGPSWRASGKRFVAPPAPSAYPWGTKFRFLLCAAKALAYYLDVPLEVRIKGEDQWVKSYNPNIHHISGL